MKQKIIQIDQEKCNGCGHCVKACHEGAIEMQKGKAVLVREDYCDGLGDCLPVCPTDAIRFIEKDILPLPKKPFVCPGKEAKKLEPVSFSQMRPNPSCLAQWPCQIKLIPSNAPYLEGADLLIAADCVAYAYGSFHRDFMCEKITLIACPKLDSDDSEKLARIFAENNIRSVSLVRMEVPCCGGLERVVGTAMKKAGKEIPLSVTIIGTNGQII